jgi:predicted  nucleic acid-binding Zn-ribbon protein
MTMYAILRAKKLKSTAAIAKSLRHTFREVPVPNADPTQTPRNRMVGAESTAEGLAKCKERWPEKRRKDAVLAIEYLITASPEAFKKHGGTLDEGKYFNDALEWLKKRHGAENVVVAGVHRDETSPHMVAYVVPIDGNGRLNCRSFLGGSTAMSAMQDDFHRTCGQPQGLDRGIKGSKAKHTTIKQFYTAARKAGEIPELSKADLAAAAIGVHTDAYKAAQEAARNVSKAAVLAGMRERATQARQNALERQEKALQGQERALQSRENTVAGAEGRLRGEKAAMSGEVEALKRQVEAERARAEKAAQEAAALRQESQAGMAYRDELLTEVRKLRRETGQTKDRGPRLG